MRNNSETTNPTIYLKDDRWDEDMNLAYNLPPKVRKFVLEYAQNTLVVYKIIDVTSKYGEDRILEALLLNFINEAVYVYGDEYPIQAVLEGIMEDLL